MKNPPRKTNLNFSDAEVKKNNIENNNNEQKII